MYVCPVCGYPSLDEVPRPPFGGGSYEICPSCGFQFGVSDDDRGYSYRAWRAKWIDRGMPWDSEGVRDAPEGWDPARQLQNVLGPKSARDQMLVDQEFKYGPDSGDLP